MNSKFEKHLNGVGAKASVLEIKNQSTPASFGNMPNGSSNPNDTYTDYRGNAASVLKGSEIWKLNGSSLVLATSVNGDGSDYISEFSVSGAEDWIDATYTFDSAKLFVPYTQWILKLCGHNLFSEAGETIQFTLTITIGEATITKDFEIARQANNFCKEFLIDFDEAADAVIKAAGADTMNIKLTCLDSTASATIYNGMSMLTVIQRRIDASAVASDEFTLEEIAAGYSHDLGWFATPEALQAAHPTGSNGDWAMVGSTDTVWTWDADSSAWVDTGTSTAANKDLSNLSNKGANISNWSSNITNCIIEIPQDINLTLSSGVLTLASGSVLTKPNGTQATTTEDKTYSASGASSYQGLVFVEQNSGAIQGVRNLSKISSGTTLPESANSQDVFFKTDENKIYGYFDSEWQVWSVAMPIALCTVTSGVITSIDKVFNGFGFIGTTIFALPGVKGLAPRGINADGTLHNLSFTTSSMLTKTLGANANNYVMTLSGSSLNAFPFKYGAPASGYITYQEEENYNYASLLKTVECLPGFVTSKNGIITNFSTKLVFHAVDYNDTEFIAHQAMPSELYIELTLPATGNTVTAPANGYLTINKEAAASGEYINMINPISNANINSIATGAMNCRLLMPVSKGDVITINYTTAGTTNWFGFIYANGSK